jgi:hypothetical protein
MNMRTESVLPYVAGIGAGAAWLVIRLWLYRAPVDFNDSLLSTGATYSSIAIGFLSTTMAVTIGINETPLMSDIRRSGFIIDFTRYIAEAIFVSLAAVIVGFVGFAPVSDCLWYQFFWFIAMVSSMGTFVRIAIIFLLIFRKLRPK